MKLRVGIIGKPNPGLDLLLSQEGFPFDWLTEYTDFDYSALVVCGTIARESKEYVEQYLKRGGGVLCTGLFFAALMNRPARRISVRYLLPDHGPEWNGIGLLDLDSECHIPEGANNLRTESGNPALFQGEWGGGYVIALPCDAGEIVVDDRVLTKSFYAARSRLPFERVARVSRSPVRKLFTRSLELLHHRRNLPYLHTWYYPGEQRSTFIFRVDTDYASKESIEKLYSLCEWNTVRATWFIDTKSQETFLDAYKNMSNHEIALHCYEHQTYPDTETNKRNIARGMELLAGIGIKAKGFAAPFGRWNAALSEAMRPFGFEYSSEFSYDYDNVPSFPLIRHAASAILQVPVHPISIGGLKRQGFSKEEMIGYFRRVVAEKEGADDPLFFYHHPNDGNEEALTWLFEHVAEQKIEGMTMLEYARWWNRRAGLKFTAEYNDGRISLESTGGSDGVRLRITNAHGKEMFVNPSGIISVSEQAWRDKPVPQPLPDDIERCRKFNPWVPLIRTEDFIHKLL